MNKRYLKKIYEEKYEFCKKLKQEGLTLNDKNIELAEHWVKTDYPFAEIVKIATGRELKTDEELDALYSTALYLRWFGIEVMGKRSKFVIAEVWE